MAKIRIKQVKSAIHRPVDQKATLIALGIRKMNHSVEHETSVSILGMVKKVQHMVEVTEIK
jgi:large subunit ribosomal protein L30